VRVTPGVVPSTHSYISTGQRDSKFGLAIEGGPAREAVEAIGRADALELAGLHCHIGSQLFDLSGYQAAAAKVADFAASLNGAGSLDVMNMGGGLGIAYTREDRPAAVEDYAEAVVEAVRGEWGRAGLRQPRILVEPGRSVVGRAGVTLYRVGSTKTIPGVRTYAAVDGGMSDLLRPMLYDAVYEPLLANRVDAEPTETLRLVGKHCESGDVLLFEARLPHDVQVGDLLATPVTGAYGQAMGSNYNKITRPPVVFVDGGTARLVVRRETLDDLLATDVG
jgi:diaminopimelate decarboxylase